MLFVLLVSQPMAMTAASSPVTIGSEHRVTAAHRYTIVSPVLLAPYLLVSAVFTGPAMEIAVEEVNEIYRGRLHFSLQLLADPRIADCTSMTDNVQDVVSEYIYRKERTVGGNDSELIAIVTPGSCD